MGPPCVSQAHGLAVEPGGVSAWRRDLVALHAGAAPRRVEGAGIAVLLEDPQVQAGRGRRVQDGPPGQGQQPGTDPLSLQSVGDMKVVDERAPGRILAEAGVGKTYDRAVALGDNSAGPWVRDGQAFGPQRQQVPGDVGLLGDLVEPDGAVADGDPDGDRPGGVV